ncbi:hypothetical protein H0R92_04660 [Treponema sp. OMZ 840]|uniref:hypothetical protein n=1 Tax=Treponema sp. OMZ 840 TaxID=244313 RepID=UPI003D8B6AF5
MAHNPVRKFIGLAFLYGIIIFGIFMLQFRNELSVSKSFGGIQLRLSYIRAKKTPQADTELSQSLKNGFYVSDKGIVFFAGESNPLILHTSDKKQIPLVLQNWEEKDKTSFVLSFSENVSLLFDGSSEQLALSAQLPKKAVSLTIPYKTTESYSVTDINQTRALIKSKAESRLLQAQLITNEYVRLSASSPAARIGIYEEKASFSFASIASFEKAQAETLKKLTEQARDKLFESFPSVNQENMSEKLVSAYVAESAARGVYHNGVNSVPPAFTDSTKRTYFSAPYFNKLIKMNQTLVMEQENISYRIQYSLEKNNLDVFELDHLPLVLLQRPPEETSPLLALPAALPDFSPTPAQAAGILDVYTTLYKVNPVSAALLSPVLKQCADFLEQSCVLSDSGSLYAEDKGNRINSILSARAAKALQEYGTMIADKNTKAGGIMLLASVLENLSSLDLRTLAEIYPYIAGDNTFYPHIDVIGFENNRPIWAWTVASKIDYTKDENDTIVFKTAFPVDETHYMILNGIDPFVSIEIYGLQYRTDPRFETYNSSGYVYDAKTKTLFLKYRQKTPVETVRLFYRQRPAVSESETDKADKPIQEEESSESAEN